MFVTINGILLNVTDVGMARATEPRDIDKIDGVRVYFISGGHTIIPDATVDQVMEVLARAAKEMAPF